jgi:hypothetical protein
MTATVVDAEGALRAWINSLTTTLVGDGKPLALGLWLGDGPRETTRLRSPYRGAYGVLARVGGGPRMTDESPWDWPRISTSVYGVTRLQAHTAAIAYANTLATLDGAPVAVTWTPPDALERVATLLVCQDITGPLWAPDGDEARYLVDAVIVATPA